MATRVRRPDLDQRAGRREPPGRPSAVLLGVASALFALSMLASLLLLFLR